MYRLHEDIVTSDPKPTSCLPSLAVALHLAEKNEYLFYFEVLGNYQSQSKSFISLQLRMLPPYYQANVFSFKIQT